MDHNMIDLTCDSTFSFEPTHINFQNGKLAMLLCESKTSIGRIENTTVFYENAKKPHTSTSRFLELKWYTHTDKMTGRKSPCRITKVGRSNETVFVRLFDSGREVGGKVVEVDFESLGIYESAIVRKRFASV